MFAQLLFNILCFFLEWWYLLSKSYSRETFILVVVVHLGVNALLDKDKW